MEITKAGVIGSGLMGSGIAEVLARSGLDVVVRDISDEAVAAGRGRIEKSFAKGVEPVSYTHLTLPTNREV